MNDSFHKTPSYYTDLMSERGRVGGEGVEFKSEIGRTGVWERVRVWSDSASRALGRPCGHYHTLNTEPFDLMDSYDADLVAEEIASELLNICAICNVTPKRILVVGLGNEELTPDALGPAAARLVEPTMHLPESAPQIFDLLGCERIAVLRPGVCAQSGLESSLSIKATCNVIMPDLVIAVDALCAESAERLGCTVQISDTGVFPGSGVGNPRSEICRDTVGCHVIAIGIPTVIDAGISSSRDGVERMLVTPREINLTVKVGANIISGAINRAFGVVR